MAPCSGNVITPKMIRTGQVHIGDKIEFEKEGNVLVSSQNFSPAEGFVAAPQASKTTEVTTTVMAGSQRAETAGAMTEPQSAEMAGVMTEPQSAEMAAAIAGSQSSELTAATTVAMKSNPEASGETPEAASDNVNHAQTVSTSSLAEQPGEKIRDSIAQEQVVPTATAFAEENSYAGDTVGNSMPSTAETGNDNGVSLRRQQPQNAGNYSQTSNQTAAQAGYNNMIYTNTAQIPLAFHQMTDYVNSLENNGTQSPIFNVPSNPLVPPEYEQTIDYDSIQYMNGFLRTQIGRYMRVEQLIGAGTLEDRYGFLVGVGNNYLLLQDISNGNVSLVDIYTVKYVYIYFGDPIFPNLSFGNSGRQ